MGAVDEVNAAIGVLRAAALPAEVEAILAGIQSALFDLGAELCMPGAPARFDDGLSVRLENEIAGMNAALSPLTSFVLPGGTAAAAGSHMARTIARRAERAVVGLSAQEQVNPAIIRFLNRLSDYLFVLARALNKGADVLWVPAQRR
jgi:cob(I)alamin adenosyltransferase